MPESQNRVENALKDRSWVEAQRRLRGTVSGWIRSAIGRQSGSPWKGGHDEANYTCSWADFYLLSGDRSIRDFLFGLRDSYRTWSAENEYHGFRADARDYATHTFENHMGFISSLCDMEPGDAVNNALIEDVAHHIGNWEAGVPDWYDWDRHMMVSHWIGTRDVKNYPPWDLTSTRHARIARLALVAYRTSGKQRYLDWCDDFLGNWCDVILASEERIPTMLYHTPREQVTEEQRAAMGRHRWADYSDPYQGLRWAGAVHEILRLMIEAYALIPNERYLVAVRKAIGIVERVAPGAPRLMPGVIATMSAYQDLTGDARYAEDIRRWADETELPRLAAAMGGPMPDTLIGPLDGRAKTFGIDGGDGTIRIYDGPRGAEYKTGYDLSGDVRYLTRAMELAERFLALSAPWVRDGREHGCGGRRYLHGEGSPAARMLHGVVGTDRVLYRSADGAPGLDADVAALATGPRDAVDIVFVNTAGDDKALYVAARPHADRADAGDGGVPVALPGGSACAAKIC